MSEKIYAPINVKARAGRFGQEFRISFNVEKMLAFIAHHKTERGYVNLHMSERKSPGRFGETHSVTLDTWQPSSDSRPAAADEDWGV